MTAPTHSIIQDAIRSFFKAAFGVIGALFGLVILVIIVSFSSGKEDSKIQKDTKLTILPNAEGSRKELSSTAPVLLQIDLEGVFGEPRLNEQVIKQQLIESRENNLKPDRVKGILLTVKSPGGTVIDSDGIYRAIKNYKEQYNVPVFAFIDGLCASGGMYSAVAADKIFATNVSIIGSIGTTISPLMNVSKLLEKIGIESRTLIAGKNKDLMNPFRPWKKGEEQPLQHIIDSFYEQFLDVIVENRPEVSREDLIKKYGANVFTAKDAVEYGFIDTIVTGKNEVIAALAEEAGLEKDSYQIMGVKNKEWDFGFLRNEWSLFRGEMTHKIAFEGDLPPFLQNQFLYYFPYTNL